MTLNKKITHKKKGKLLIIFDYISQMTFDLHNTNQAMLNHIKNMRDVILELNPEVRKNVILRLNRSFYENFYGIKYYNFFKDLNVQIDNGEKKISNLIKEARLTLFNYDSTGILENFIHNVPTVFFCEKNFFNTLNRNYVIKYKYLFKNNVIFLDKTKIKNHLNNNWDNISDLWFSSKNQKMLKTFNKNYNVKPNLGDINKIKKILLSKTQ